MYLKRMELFGFKSFAEKTELVFSPGIAAVIGPNGCGKSNLVDAVRWALGEQSVKSLRGNRMEEVIFSGSENRKPLNFAEVSLTFTDADEFLNLDYDEVTITRRLFRSGESEYYINKSPCRLKDITEMFLDTGLGKEVYSVIGQGRVDEIINSRPEERREIFEEAAGIFKYKLRKREAQRRLEETRENLIRVQDLIFELETQIEPLREQAEVTRQYRELKQKIDNEEKKLLSYRLTRSREQLEKINRQLQTVSDNLVSAAARGGKHEKEVQELKQNLQDQQAHKSELEQKLNRLSSTLEQQESELRVLQERETRFNEQLEQNRTRVEKLDLMMEEQHRQKSGAEEDLKQRKKELEELNEQLEQLREELAEHEDSPLAEEVEKQQEKIYQAAARKEAAISTIEELNRRLERIGAQKKVLQDEINDLQGNLTQAQETTASLEGEIEDLEKELVSAEGLEKSEIENEEKARRELEKLTREEQEKKEELYGVNSRLSLLKEQDSALTGYYRGVKEIMQARSKLPGIIGPVADIISVDEKYIQAVESALGAALQYLVAESEKDVHRAIAFLKENNRGWATFLPLDILHQSADPLSRHGGWDELEGVIDRASNLVKADRAYRKVIDYLMSSILVCHGLEHASKAARFIKHSCRVVTLQGEMINPGGVIRGGSLPGRNAGMPLGRRKEIEKLTARQAELEKARAEAASKVEEAKNRLAAQQKQVEEAAGQRRRFAGQLEEIQKKAEAQRREQENCHARLKAGEKTKRELDNEESDINRRMSSLQQEIDEAENEIARLENELAGKKEDYRHFLNEKKNLEHKITETLIKISSYREQRDALQARIKVIEDNINKPAAEKQEKQQEDERFKNELAENREAQESTKTRIEELNEEKAALLNELENTNSRVNEFEAELLDLEEQDKRRQSQVARQEKREKNLSVEQTRLQTEINYQEMRFRELFQSLEPAELDDDFDPEECRTQVENLKEDLEELGEVNLGAIEELSRLEERINFLKDQREDLQNGEVSLKKVLAEIDQRMEYYFKTAFEQIGENFKETFKELFDGGQVMLKLTDADNILESGIEIIAQPPGKKLQNITLLSAGEKVLTAIALVFAILRFKPAPFYVLDEVESTLDDANLYRFTRFLSQLARRAQFIMITHRKRTMEESGVLYGVTMPEPGISRLVSLNIDENKEIKAREN